MKRTVTALTGTSCIIIAGAAYGGGGLSVRAEVDELGGPVTMNPRSLGTMFGAPASQFTDASLSAFNSEIQNAGIPTDGKITFLFAETEEGLSWVTLIDDENQPGDFQIADSQVGMATTGPSTANIFVNDDQGDLALRVDLGNGTQLATGSFAWDSVREADGFAWTDLMLGDFVAFNFTDIGPAGLNSPVFQFVNWTGQTWEVAATADFSSADQFAYTFTIVPAPATLGLLGLASAVLPRRRRRA